MKILTRLIPSDYSLSTQEKDSITAPHKQITVVHSRISDDPEFDPDDPSLTVPRARYNSMLAVLRNTLYMYVFSS